mgnify:CR=1 FL=1
MNTVLTLPKAFTKEQCENIISFHIDWIESEGYVDENRKIETSYRRCIVYEPTSEERAPSWLIEKIFNIILVANKEIFHFDLGKGNIDFNLIKYDPGGLYNTHIDLGEGTSSSLRKISFTVLLNDSYEGGKLRFGSLPSLSKNYPEKGGMIIFPSYLTHRVEPVTAGVRWVLVGWIISDNPFR